MKKIVFALLLFPVFMYSQTEIGINTNNPIFDLDIRGVDNDELVQEGSVIQLTDVSQSHFLRLFSGRGNDPRPFIAFSDADTFSIVRTAPDWSTFKQLLSVTPGGNVGIRTIYPLYDLDVRGLDNEQDGGELQLATPDETNFLRLFGGRQADRNPFIAFNDQDTFHLVTTSTDWSTYQRRLTMIPNGNVGIGTVNPLARLDIEAPGDSSSLIRLGTDRPWFFRQYSTGPSTTLALQSDTNDKIFEIMSPEGNRAASFFVNNVFSRILLSPDTTNAVVGIGLSNPQAKLHILHNSTQNSPQIELTEDGDDYGRIKFTSTANPGARWTIAGQADTLFDNSRLNFYYSGPEGSGDRVTIRGNGNVGFQVFSPEATVDIKGGRWNLEGGNEGDVRIGTTSHNLRIGVATGGGGAGLSRIYSTTGLWLGTADVPAISIDPQGLVGVGTTSPQEQLHVLGNMRVSGLSGAGDRNVIVDSDGKFKIGNIGGGGSDNDWVEGVDVVYNSDDNIGIGTSNPLSRLTIVSGGSDGTNGSLKMIQPGTPPFYTDAVNMVMDANDIDVNGTLFNTLNLQRNSAGGIEMVEGGGGVGIGTGPTSSVKLIVQGNPIPSSGDPATVGSSFSIINTSNGFSQMIMDGNEISTVDEALFLNRISDHDVRIADGGGTVGIGVAPNNSKLRIEGPDNDGTVGAIEIRSAGTGQTMLLDGNEIDVKTGAQLALNSNSGLPVTIGTQTIATGYALSVGGKIMAEEVRVQLEANWPDYVFSESYELMSLDEVKKSIEQNGHLPGIPSAKQVESDGLQVGEMQRKMMEKIEELTLHVIQLNERLESLEKENSELKARIK